MSYSDYGGYAWTCKVVNKDFVLDHYEAAEDGTLSGISRPQNRPLEKATGLKLDTLVNAYTAKGMSYSEEEPEGFDWHVDHPQHCVLGSTVGLGLCNHKGTVSLLWDGKCFGKHPKDDSHSWEREDELLGDKDGTFYAVKAIMYPHSVGSMMLMITPEKEIYLGVAGYGIGDQFWKNENGQAYLYPGDRWDEATKMWFWSGIACEEDLEKYNTSEEFEPIGIKPDEPWPTYNDWKERVAKWATDIIKTKI